MNLFTNVNPRLWANVNSLNATNLHGVSMRLVTVYSLNLLALYLSVMTHVESNLQTVKIYN